MALEDDVFKVPDSIPPFSKRQRHISRLSEEWPFGAIPDDFYDDLPYCSFKEKSLHKGALAPLADFTELNLRKISTSTPFHRRASDSQIPDSCLMEHDVSSTFSSSCTLNSTQDSGRYSMCSDISDLDTIYASLPLPRLSLESEFESCAKSQESDSAYESSYGSQDTLSDCFSQTTDLDLAASIANLPSCATPDLPPQDNLNQILKKFTPTEPDRLIGRRIGRQHVDIVSELSFRNMPSVLHLILDGVSDTDLSRMCSVSKQWKKVCDEDSKARARRVKMLEERRLHRLQLQKENVTIRRKRHQTRSMTKGKGLLGEVQLSTPPTLTTLEKQIPKNLFWEEASKLHNDESLRKCPKCSSPAKCVDSIQDRALCSKCQHDFCVKCLRCFHGATDCSVVIRKKTKTETSVGKKKKVPTATLR